MQSENENEAEADVNFPVLIKKNIEVFVLALHSI